MNEIIGKLNQVRLFSSSLFFLKWKIHLFNRDDHEIPIFLNRYILWLDVKDAVLFHWCLI